MQEYFNDSLDIDAIVYLTLAQVLMKSITHKKVISIAEDVSGFPGLATSLFDGGIGFDYRLNMAIPDFWIKYLKDTGDEDWNVFDMVRVYMNVRSDEKVISYCESHDQAIVGDKTLSMWLFSKEIYTNMSNLKPKTIIGFRAIGLHKLIRFLTILLGDAYLNFMGNEFGHPEWIDFPRKENGFSYYYCRRQWHLSEDSNLYFSDLKRFDSEMIDWEKKLSFGQNWKRYFIDYHGGDGIVSFEENGILIVFNFNSTKV